MQKVFKVVIECKELNTAEWYQSQVWTDNDPEEGTLDDNVISSKIVIEYQ